jgi:hypothetical protein
VIKGIILVGAIRSITMSRSLHRLSDGTGVPGIEMRSELESSPASK